MSVHIEKQVSKCDNCNKPLTFIDNWVSVNMRLKKVGEVVITDPDSLHFFCDDSCEIDYYQNKRMHVKWR